MPADWTALCAKQCGPASCRLAYCAVLTAQDKARAALEGTDR